MLLNFHHSCRHVIYMWHLSLCIHRYYSRACVSTMRVVLEWISDEAWIRQPTQVSEILYTVNEPIFYQFSATIAFCTLYRVWNNVHFCFAAHETRLVYKSQSSITNVWSTCTATVSHTSQLMVISLRACCSISYNTIETALNCGCDGSYHWFT